MARKGREAVSLIPSYEIDLVAWTFEDMRPNLKEYCTEQLTQARFLRNYGSDEKPYCSPHDRGQSDIEGVPWALRSMWGHSFYRSSAPGFYRRPEILWQVTRRPDWQIVKVVIEGSSTIGEVLVRAEKSAGGTFGQWREMLEAYRQAQRDEGFEELLSPKDVLRILRARIIEVETAKTEVLKSISESRIRLETRIKDGRVDV